MLLLDNGLREKESLRPNKATAGSAAMDLRACIVEPVEIAPGEVVEIGLGIAIHINDPNLCGVIAPRSGLGTKHGIVLANTVGVIDSDYTGELRASAWNRGDKPYTVNPYERLCQLMVLPICLPEISIVESFTEKSSRGAAGFGSTGRF